MKPIPSSKTPSAIQLMQWILNPIDYLETNFQRYGDIFAGNVSPLDPVPYVLLNHPQFIQYLLTHDTGKEFSAPGEGNAILKPLLGEKALALISGDRHRWQRHLVLPPFHGERLKIYGELICQITQEIMGSLPPNQPFSAGTVMQQITLKVVMQAVFGLYEGERYQRLEKLLCDRLNIVGSTVGATILFFPILQTDVGSWSPGGRLRQLNQETDEIIFAEIQARRDHPSEDRNDILSMLLAAKDEQGQGLSNQELRDNLMNLLMAGYDTTSTSLAWALYWIHSLPEVKQKLLAELDQAGDTDPKTLLGLPYLNAICNETLRIYPVGMLTLPRRAEIPVEIGGYTLEPGTLVAGCIYLVHHREDLYPDSYKFRPERFLERQFSPYEFLPFGGGIRRCIGSALAQYEMKLVLATMLKQWQWELVDRKPIQPRRRTLTLEPDSPIQLRKTEI
jgi:cytochrome P450